MNDIAGRGIALVRRVWSLVALPLISILLGLLVGAVVILVSQVIQPTKPFDPTLPITGYIGLFRGAFGTFEGQVDTLVFATPLVLGGLSVALAFKAGLFNIGAHGQFLVGALASVAIGVTFNTSPAIVAIPMALGAGMLAGAAWGFIPGFLKAVSGAHEVVTTIMLNYIALTVVAAMVSGPLDQPGSPSPITDDVGTAALPIIIGRSGHLGILIAGVVVLLVAWLLYRTTRGFEIRTVGANPDAARYAGMRPRYILVLTMSLAGLLAGMSGATVVLGVTHLMTASFGSTVGFDSIAVALLGRSNPFGVVFAALLFGAMRAGAPQLQLQAGIPTEIVDVLQATILLFLVASPYIRRALRLRGVKEPVAETDTISKTYGSETVG
ncbi:MAG TPA: ABC transporter permease [Candidatus Limnocylindrales bacterium]|nr:ABC transporter permease [Candidatus Limnocylindrales bacterium]